MKSTLLDIIPRPFRRRSIGVAFTVFARALLNFLGLALLLPVLMMILDARSIHTNPWLAALYERGGFTSDRLFVALLCGGVVAVILIKSLLVLALYRSERNFIHDLYAHLSHRLYVAYHNRGLPFIKSANSAELSRNVNVVCLTFVSGVLRPIATIAGEAALFMLLFAAFALYDITAAGLILLVFLPAAWLYYALVRNRLNRYGENENRAHREKARTVAETFRGYPDIEINNAFPSLLDRFDRATAEVVRTRSKEATVGMLPQMFTEVGLALGMALLVIIGSGADGERMRLLFGIFAVAALRLMPSVRSVLAAWSAIKYNRYTIGILHAADLAHADTSVERETERMPFRRSLEVRHLSFRYPDAERETLSDLSLTLRRGERLGIRGASGAGKTTLFNLLLGFYEPTGGEILIDGVPLTRENRRRWQNNVGYVSQNVFIADSTFLANVALGTPEELIDRRRAERALEAARLGTFVSSLPRGMDTPIGECGCRLSGGQRQRIGIARALYRQADVLFFDEATSSLDSRTEEDVNRSIAELSDANKELTIVVIAHRDSSLDYCDRVVIIGEQTQNTH